MLANSSGKFSRFMIAIWLSQLVERIASITKREERPSIIRNRAEKVPSRPKSVTCDRSRPSRTAMRNTMADCTKPRIIDERTFAIGITPRAKGVLSNLFRNHSLLSQTIDIPLFMAVKSAMKDNIPTARNEK